MAPKDSNTVSVHATSTWILGLEKEKKNGDVWDSLDITNNPTFNLDKDTENGSGRTNISGGGTTIEAIRTSDLGYGDDELGVNQEDGDMVLFDLDPTRWSWSDGSPDLRPGLHNDSVPRVPNGHVEYDTGEKEDIPNNGAWIEDTSKGSSAKITTQREVDSKWVGGEEPMYYWGTRDDREELTMDGRKW